MNRIVHPLFASTEEPNKPSDALPVVRYSMKARTEKTWYARVNSFVVYSKFGSLKETSQLVHGTVIARPVRVSPFHTCYVPVVTARHLSAAPLVCVRCQLESVGSVGVESSERDNRQFTADAAGGSVPIARRGYTRTPDPRPCSPHQLRSDKNRDRSVFKPHNVRAHDMTYRKRACGENNQTFAPPPCGVAAAIVG